MLCINLYHLSDYQLSHTSLLMYRPTVEWRVNHGCDSIYDKVRRWPGSLVRIRLIRSFNSVDKCDGYSTSAKQILSYVPY
jgi:hypothetical protein